MCHHEILNADAYKNKKYIYCNHKSLSDVNVCILYLYFIAKLRNWLAGWLLALRISASGQGNLKN